MLHSSIVHFKYLCINSLVDSTHALFVLLNLGVRYIICSINDCIVALPFERFVDEAYSASTCSCLVKTYFLCFSNEFCISTICESFTH